MPFLVHDTANTTCRRAFRAWKGGAAPREDWLRETTAIDSQEHHADLTGQATARVPSSQKKKMLCYFGWIQEFTKRTVRLKSLECKIGGVLTQRQVVPLLTEGNKQILAPREFKGSRGFMAAVARESTGLGMTALRGTNRLTSCHQETNRGACQA